jgi:hypothetical protein
MRPLFFIVLSGILLLGGSWIPAAEPPLSTAGAPYAPLDVSKKSQDPLIPLTAGQRVELLSEFKGLVHLGMRKTPFESWGAKEMADCERPGQGSGDTWSHKCEIITGQGNGFYYFYPNETRQTATLQAVDIRVHASDQRLLDDFKLPVQDMFGRASLVETTTVKSKPTSPIRRWSTVSDVIELFMDRSVRPEGSVRFVWKRAPLVSTAQASLPKTDN